MNCVTAREELEELLARGESEPLTGELASHVASCAACGEEIKSLRRAVAGIASMRVFAAPAGFADALMARLPQGPAPSEAPRPAGGGRPPLATALALAGAGAVLVGALAYAVRPGIAPVSRGARATGAVSASPTMPPAEDAGRAEQTSANAGEGAPERQRRSTEPSDAGGTAAHPTAAPATLHGLGATVPASATASVPAAAGPTRGPAGFQPRTENLDGARQGRPLDQPTESGNLEHPLDSNRP